MSCQRNTLLALDGRAVDARSAMTEWVNPRSPGAAATHSGRFAATSPIKGEETWR